MDQQCKRRIRRTAGWVIGFAGMAAVGCQPSRSGAAGGVAAAGGSSTGPGATSGEPVKGGINRMDLPEINVEEARRRLDSGQGYVYLDVRTVEEFAAGHAPGALNIPVAFRDPESGRMRPNENFVPEVQRVLAHDRKIICGCRSGGRSATAQQLLAEAGFSQTVNMMGGFLGKSDMSGRILAPGWATSGYPLCAHEDGSCRGYDSLKERS